MGAIAPHSNVVCLASARARLHHPALDAVERYWDGLRGPGGLPYRRDVDPRGLGTALERAFILEHIGSGLARFRVAGTHLRELVDLDLRGMPLSVLFGAGARRDLAAVLETAFQRPAIVRLGLGAMARADRGKLEGEMVLLPLIGDREQVNRALGALSLVGDTGRAPRPLVIRTQSITDVPLDVPAFSGPARYGAAVSDRRDG